MVIVADDSEAADRRLARVLWYDPATGVIHPPRPANEDVIACAKEKGLNLPGG